MVFPDVDVFFDHEKTSWARNMISAHFASCRTDEDYLLAWCKYGGGHPLYGLYRTEFLRRLDPERHFDVKMVYYNEGMFLHHAFLDGGLRFSPDAKLLYSGFNSTQLRARTMLASFLKYSSKVHWLYLSSQLPISQKARLLRLVGGTHYPYIGALIKKALRNEIGC